MDLLTVCLVASFTRLLLASRCVCPAAGATTVALPDRFHIMARDTQRLYVSDVRAVSGVSHQGNVINMAKVAIAKRVLCQNPFSAVRRGAGEEEWRSSKEGFSPGLCTICLVKDALEVGGIDAASLAHPVLEAVEYLSMLTEREPARWV